jgi:hypothetical protein
MNNSAPVLFKKNTMVSVQAQTLQLMTMASGYRAQFATRDKCSSSAWSVTAFSSIALSQMVFNVLITATTATMSARHLDVVDDTEASDEERRLLPGESRSPTRTCHSPVIQCPCVLVYVSISVLQYIYIYISVL